MELERKVVERILYEPNVVKTTNIKTEWFSYPPFRQLVELVLETGGQEKDPLVLFEKLKEKNPLTTYSTEAIYDMQAEGFYGQDLDKRIKLLEQRYYKQLLDKAIEVYAKESTHSNYLIMKDRMIAMEKIELPEDDGTLDLVMDEINYELENEVEDGIKFYPGLTDILGGGILGGEFMIIGARPATGKTAYAINLAVEADKNNDDIAVDVFTLEMTKKQMSKRFLSRKTEINSYKFRNPAIKLNDAEKETVRGAVEMLTKGNLRIFDKPRTIGDISKIITRRAYDNKDKNYLVFVDYIGLIRSSEGKTETRHVLDEVSRDLKELTTTLNIPIIALAQLSRGIEGRQEKKPMLSDLRDSGSLEQDANIVAFIWEPNKDDPMEEQYTELSIAKSREGITGDIKYQFVKSKMCFEEI